MTNLDEVEGSCMASAKRLLEKYPGAKVIWLNSWPDTQETRASNKGDPPDGHAYVIPLGAKPTDLALNQSSEISDQMSVAALDILVQHSEWTQDITQEVRENPIEKFI